MSARRAAFIAAAFVLVGLTAAFRLQPGRQDESEPGPTQVQSSGLTVTERALTHTSTGDNKEDRDD